MATLKMLRKFVQAYLIPVSYDPGKLDTLLLSESEIRKPQIKKRGVMEKTLEVESFVGVCCEVLTASTHTNEQFK